MHLTPRELDKLTLHQAGFLAQKRLARGVRLNTPRPWRCCHELLEFTARPVARGALNRAAAARERGLAEGISEMIGEGQ